jgi:hypothetical protein
MTVKAYILIDSSFAIDKKDDADYFFKVVSNSLKEYDWLKIYTDDIPLDGNIYVCLATATSSLYRLLVSTKRFKPKDILNDFILDESSGMYVVSFNYELDAIRQNPEVKRSAFRFLIDTVKPNIDKVLSIVNGEAGDVEKTEEIAIKEETVSISIIPEDSGRKEAETIREPTESELEEMFFYIDDIVSKMVSSSTIKIADRGLDTFEGIQIISSSNPNHFITLASSARKDYPNKILVSELFIIIKAAKMVGADSIKFNVRKGT